MRRVGWWLVVWGCQGGGTPAGPSGPVGDDSTGTGTPVGDDTAAVTLVDEGCDDARDAGVYDPFPETAAIYPSGTPASLAWSGEDFETYSDGQLVEDDADRARRDHLEVVAGTLTARNPPAGKRGWSDDGRFLALATTTDGALRAAWTDVRVSGQAYVDAWAPGSEGWANIGLVVRYQTDDDFVFASLRKSGDVVIQRKHCGVIETLAQDTFGTTNTEQWYRLSLAARGSTLTLSVDDQVVLEAQDDTLTWGLAGVLHRDGEVWYDDWGIAAP